MIFIPYRYEVLIRYILRLYSKQLDRLMDSNGMSTYRDVYMSRYQGIAFIVHLYEYFLCSFLRVFILHSVLWYQVFPFNSNNLQTYLFDT